MRTLPVAVEHDVGRLEIAVDDAAFVRGGEAGADLARDLERASSGKRPMRRSSDARSSPSTYSIDRNVCAVDLADVVDAADVRMRHLPRHPDFGVQLRQARRIAVDVGRQELQRDRLPELQVVGAIHLAHAAAAEPADDAVAAAEERAGREAAVVDGAGRREPAARAA